MVAVTGMSPQIVTETIYALHTKHQWTPNQIIVLTTLAGRKKSLMNYWAKMVISPAYVVIMN